MHGPSPAAAGHISCSVSCKACWTGAFNQTHTTMPLQAVHRHPHDCSPSTTAAKSRRLRLTRSDSLQGQQQHAHQASSASLGGHAPPPPACCFLPPACALHSPAKEQCCWSADYVEGRSDDAAQHAVLLLLIKTKVWLQGWEGWWGMARGGGARHGVLRGGQLAAGTWSYTTACKSWPHPVR